MKFFSCLAAVGATFIALTTLPARAAQLVMFEQAGCVWCQTFDRQIAPVYDRTEDGLRAPLRRVDIARPLPPDLSFLHKARFTPVFVLVDEGRAIGRIFGYAGPESFWTQLSILMDKLDAIEIHQDRAQIVPISLRMRG